jgi:hypothetical protein
MLTVMLFSKNLVIAQNTEVKKSAKSGICYGADSKFYKKLKDFIPCKTMDECIVADEKTQKAKTAAKKKSSLIKD